MNRRAGLTLVLAIALFAPTGTTLQAQSEFGFEATLGYANTGGGYATVMDDCDSARVRLRTRRGSPTRGNDHRERDAGGYLGYQVNWIHTLNGGNGNHVVHLAALRAGVPIRGTFGLGVDGIVFLRNSFFTQFTDITQRVPQLRLYAQFDVR